MDLAHKLGLSKSKAIEAGMLRKNQKPGHVARRQLLTFYLTLKLIL